MNIMNQFFLSFYKNIKIRLSKSVDSFKFYNFCFKYVFRKLFTNIKMNYLVCNLNGVYNLSSKPMYNLTYILYLGQ